VPTDKTSPPPLSRKLEESLTSF